MGDWANTYHLLETKTPEAAQVAAEAMLSDAAAAKSIDGPDRWDVRVGYLHPQLLLVETQQKWGYADWVPGFVSHHLFRHIGPDCFQRWIQVCPDYNWFATGFGFGTGESAISFGWDYIAQIAGAPIDVVELLELVSLGGKLGTIGKSACIRLPFRVGFTQANSSWIDYGIIDGTQNEYLSGQCLELNLGRCLAERTLCDVSFLLGFEASGYNPIHTARLDVVSAPNGYKNVSLRVSLVSNPLPNAVMRSGELYFCNQDDRAVYSSIEL